ncbi:hypothetical protein Taro_024961 [Colocasia esculenta]|uniref:Pulmonary surfactant-associated protein B n=1 Tax=Colocasia esculenta TaxID=4460 RepID=A0A843VF61_COLES|nr:hypothetical protein [Colocasia esculenta]
MAPETYSGFARNRRSSGRGISNPHSAALVLFVYFNSRTTFLSVLQARKRGGFGGGEEPRHQPFLPPSSIFTPRLPSPSASSAFYGQRRMGDRLMFLFLLFLSINWIHADARSLEISDPAVLQVPGIESSVLSENIKTEKLCTLCEQFTAQAVEYLSNNKTQTEIIENLHHACFQLHNLKEQCILLVDYYAPLFFVEVGLVHPEDFCTKVNLCTERTFLLLLKREDPCSICQRTIVEVLVKLKDPDTQLEIIETLIKACNKVEHFSKQCKKLVFEYGPVILINAEKFLETTDVCVAIHACKADQKEMIVQASVTEVFPGDA